MENLSQPQDQRHFKCDPKDSNDSRLYNIELYLVNCKFYVKLHILDAHIVLLSVYETVLTEAALGHQCIYTQMVPSHIQFHTYCCCLKLFCPDLQPLQQPDPSCSGAI